VRRIVLLKTLTAPWTAANSSWSLGLWDWGRGRQVALTDVHCRLSRVCFNAIDKGQLSTGRSASGRCASMRLSFWRASSLATRPWSRTASATSTRSCGDAVDGGRRACAVDATVVGSDSSSPNGQVLLLATQTMAVISPRGPSACSCVCMFDSMTYLPMAIASS
jgi:hypothetical protein